MLLKMIEFLCSSFEVISFHVVTFLADGVCEK
uniref:Cyclic lactone autoinducer peptide n=1 Tax=Heterorhabditis bacteriophora TaxID=37862 RepID=A0A1I7XER2_HETBA